MNRLPPNDPQDDFRRQLVAALQSIDANLAKLCKLLDDFIGTHLNAQFPYGKPTDRWGRR